MAIIVKCRRGSATRSGADIRDSLISTRTMASARGKRFLDDPDQGGYYVCRRYTLRVPIKAHLVPGDWITVTCARLGLSAAKMRVMGSSISGGRNEKWAALEVATFEVPA